MQGKGRFKEKKKSTPGNAVQKSRSGSRPQYFEEGHANKFNTLGLNGIQPSTQPNGRRGKKMKGENWLESQSQSSDTSPDRMAGKQR